MHIIIFSTDYPSLIGGISTYTYQIAKNLSHINRVVVLAPHFDGDSEFDRKQEFRTLRIINIPIIREILFTYHIVKIQLTMPIDFIFNAVWFPCALISYLIHRLIKIKYVVAAHGSEFLDDKLSLKRRIKSLLRGLKVRVFTHAAMVLPISDYTKRKLLDLGIPSKNITILNNGTDTETFRPGAKDPVLMKKYNIGEKSQVLLTVGRLDLHKGHDMVVKALPKILEEVPDLVYFIVGDGPEKKRLQNLISLQNLSSMVKMVGWVTDDELADHYRLCDVFIMASREIPGRLDLLEGFGIAFLEAGACAKPVIGGRSSGVADAIIHEQTGLLVDPFSQEEIATAVIRLCKDKGYADKLGLNGLERCRKELNWPAVCGRLQSLLENFRTPMKSRGMGT